MSDFKFSLRALRKSPGFTATAVATLALGIGANTAIFSLVHAVILKPLAFRDPSQLVTIWDTYQPQFSRIGISPAELEAWRKQTDLFRGSAWYRSVPQNLTMVVPDGDAIEVHGGMISAELLPLLGVSAQIGAAFSSGAPANTVLLSNRLWRTRFSANPAWVGRSIRLNRQEYAIAGVMPADFSFPDFADIWLPNGPLMGDELTNPVRHSLGFIARLQPGITVETASQRSHEILRRLAAEHPKTSKGWGAELYGLQEDLTAKMRPALLILMGAVALVLLVACTNVANLLLSRAASRSREIALRTALGAGAWRILRQLAVESAVLSTLGGGLGLALAEFSLSKFSPVREPLDSAVLWFSLAISLGAGLIFSLIPAVQALDADPGSVIKSTSVPAGGSKSLRNALVIAEFALALVLATGSGTLVESFGRLMHVNPGFEPQRLLTLRLSLPAATDPGPLFRRITSRLLELPGVESVAATNELPLDANRAFTGRFSVPGSSLINPDALPVAQLRAATPGFFHTLGVPLLSGREFRESDASSDAVIINETMARRFWPGRDPVGLRFITGPWGPNPTYGTIVGVVGDVKQFGLDSEATFDLYLPAKGARFIVARFTGDPSRMAATVERAVRVLDSSVPVSDVRTMENILGESAQSRRWTMLLLTAFAGLALVLAVVGIYGVMAWTVSQRTREIGVRMALGANAGEVRSLVLAYGLKLGAAGTAIGLVGAFALRRLLGALVFQTSPSDPRVYAMTAGLMLAVAALASYLPGRRASRVNPLVALRWE